MDLNFYLDEAKKSLDIKRDAVLAERLGMTRQDLNKARKKGWCNDSALKALAEITGADEGVLVLVRDASRAGDHRHIYARAAELLKQAGAVAGIGAVLLSGSLLTGERANAATLRDEFQRSLLPEIGRRRKLAIGYFFLRFFGGLKSAVSCI